MIRRLLWISVGVGATIYVLRKVNQANAVVSHLTPGGMAAAVNNLAESLKSLTTEFSASMAEHQQALTEILLTDPPTRSTASRAWDGDGDDFAYDEGDPHEFF